MFSGRSFRLQPGDKQAASDEEPKVLTAKLAAPESAAKMKRLS